MDDTKLRALERQYKLRVKTGCETCRIRRVKCDETKPECLRCVNSRRTCGGYKHVCPNRDQNPAAAASFRNPAFLVVPISAPPPSRSISRLSSPTLSGDPTENRSFHYFRHHTLPQWTEFFDSALWNQQILQMSHTEPAIKHGILALSSLHERFESTLRAEPSAKGDFAFLQYMQAVKHSNTLISSFQRGKAPIEKVLMANIIFICYENLAGNYKSAAMHLRNGLRILSQHQRMLTPEQLEHAYQEPMANVLYRFDLQAMTFSDNASPYEYKLEDPPYCPQVLERYTDTASARDDLVGLLRCMMWVSGVANMDPDAMSNPYIATTFEKMMASFQNWVSTFEAYESSIPDSELRDPKLYAGRTLLKMYSLMAQTIGAAGAGLGSEMAWDGLIDNFRMVVELGESLPTITKKPEPKYPSKASSSTPSSKRNSRRTSSSSDSPPDFSSYHIPQPQEQPKAKLRPLAPATHCFSSKDFEGIIPPTIPSQTSPKASSSTMPSANSPKAPPPPSFSPSFELSPLVPLFIVACRCRDPLLRRRAIRLLLSSRRREGVWDSAGAGKVADNWVRIEEGLGFEDIHGKTTIDPDVDMSWTTAPPQRDAGWDLSGKQVYVVGDPDDKPDRYPPMEREWVKQPMSIPEWGGVQDPASSIHGLEGQQDMFGDSFYDERGPYSYPGRRSSRSHPVRMDVVLPSVEPLDWSREGFESRRQERFVKDGEGLASGGAEWSPPLGKVSSMREIGLERRVLDVFIGVRIPDGEVDVRYKVAGGEIRRCVRFWPCSACGSFYCSH